MFAWPERPPLAWIFLVGYAGLLWHSLLQSSLPSVACSEQTSCLYPLVQPGDRLSLELWTFQPSENARFRWNRVETCLLNVTLPSSGIFPKEVTSETENCTLALPEVSRIRWSKNSFRKGGPLRAKFVFREIEANKRTVVEVTFELTKIVERSSFSSVFSASDASARRNLLNEPIPSDENTARMHTYVPYLKYGSQPIVLRFVADTRPYGGPPYIRKDGMKMLPWNQTTYRPQIYVDENALQRSMQQEIAPPEDAENKPPATLRIQIGTLSPIRDALNQQVTVALSMAESMLTGGELDEFRYWLRDERLYRFFLTQVISFIHVWVDYLAFRDEVGFYKNKTNFVGISVSSVLTRLVCSIIIFLYLLDGGGTSWVVLISVFSSVAVDGWKAFKLLRPCIIGSYPFMTFHIAQNTKEQATAQYDRIAITYLAFFLYPLVIGWAVYALKVRKEFGLCDVAWHPMYGLLNSSSNCLSH